MKIRIALALVALGASLAAIWLAATGRADTIDDDYVAVLTANGIPGTPAQMIGNGHAVCHAFAAGTSFLDVVVELSTYGDITMRQAAYETGAAVGAYCSQYRGLIENPATGSGSATPVGVIA
jgi:hypothetical protein